MAANGYPDKEVNFRYLSAQAKDFALSNGECHAEPFEHHNLSLCLILVLNEFYNVSNF